MVRCASAETKDYKIGAYSDRPAAGVAFDETKYTACAEDEDRRKLAGSQLSVICATPLLSQNVVVARESQQSVKLCLAEVNVLVTGQCANAIELVDVSNERGTLSACA